MDQIKALFQGSAFLIVMNIISLVLFLILFVAILVRTYRMPRKEAEDIKKSILEN